MYKFHGEKYSLPFVGTLHAKLRHVSCDQIGDSSRHKKEAKAQLAYTIQLCMSLRSFRIHSIMLEQHVYLFENGNELNLAKLKNHWGSHSN